MIFKLKDFREIITIHRATCGMAYLDGYRAAPLRRNHIGDPLHSQQ